MNKVIIKHLEGVLEGLEDKCINKVEASFDSYLLDLVIDFNGEIGLFGKEDWYNYWLENVDEINRIIKGICSQKRIDNDLLLRAIKLKRVTDWEILKYCDDISVIEKDLGLNPDKHNKVIRLGVNEDIQAGFIEKFYRLLISHKWIDCNLEEFNSNFQDSENQVSINWIYRQRSLIALIKLMQDEKLISRTPRAADVIVNHFKLNKKDIKLKSIEVELSGIGSDKNMSEVSEVVRNLMDIAGNN